MYELKPPVQIYDKINIADMAGHLCTCENEEIAKAILSALLHEVQRSDAGRRFQDAISKQGKTPNYDQD